MNQTDKIPVEHIDKGDMSQSTRRVVSALDRFLMEVEMEKLINFLESLKVQYSISYNRKANKDKYRHHCKIYVQELIDGNVTTIREYFGSHQTSTKFAVCDALAQFLLYEEDDYHEYDAMMGGPCDEPEDEHHA